MKVWWLGVFCVLTYISLFAENIPTVVKGNLVYEFIEKELHLKPDDFCRTSTLAKYMDEKDLSLDKEEDLQKIYEAYFSPNSTDSIGKIFSALAKPSYSNAIAVGKAGVGKSFLVDQVTLLYSFDVAPDYLRRILSPIQPPPKPQQMLQDAFFKKTNVFVINPRLLSQNVNIRGQPWAKQDERMKATLTLLFEAAKKEFHRQNSKGNRIGTRTLFLIEEVATFPPLVQETLKSLLDETGYQNPEVTAYRRKEAGYHVLGLTTPDEYRNMIAGDSAVERRYVKVLMMEPSEQEAYNIARKETDNILTPTYGIHLEDDVIELLVTQRKLLGNPPLPMPASTLGAVADLIQWKLKNPGKDPEIVDLEDAQKFLIETARLTDIWFETPEKPLFEDIEERLKFYVKGQDRVVKAIAEKLKNWARFRFGGPAPVFFLGGPSGIGKNTLIKALNMVLFGHTADELIFPIGGSQGFHLNSLIEGPPLGNHNDGSQPTILKAFDNSQGHGILAFDEAADTDSAELDKLKTLLERSSILPVGVDTRERPLLFPIFIMGQWGEEVLRDRTPEEAEAWIASLSEDQLDQIFMLGRNGGKTGSLSKALLDRAKRTGGIHLMGPVASSNFPSILRFHSNAFSSLLHKTEKIELILEPSYYERLDQHVLAKKIGVRALVGLSDTTIEKFLSKLRSKGLGLRKKKIRISFVEGNFLLDVDGTKHSIAFEEIFPPPPDCKAALSDEAA